MHIKIRLLLVFNGIVCAAHAGSSSFFMPRSTTHNPLYELASSNYHAYHTEGLTGLSWSISPFYIRSHHSSKLARYFLPQNRRRATIQEDGSGTLGSLWFELMAPPGLNYRSRISLHPERSAVGSLVNVRWDGHTFFSSCAPWLHHLWASLSFAAMKVHHRIGIVEQLIESPHYGTIAGIKTGINALNNPRWHAGKLSPCTHTHTGVDDIQVKVGKNWFFHNEQSHIGVYAVGTIPTGNRPNSRILFEPLVGTKHSAFGAGFNSDVSLYEGIKTTVHGMCDIKYRFVRAGCERRSFDLCANGEWSRYLLMADQRAPAVSIPGINVLTLPVTVTPGHDINAWFALHIQRCALHIECGYTLWHRSQDKNLCFLRSVPSTIGIYDLAGAVTAHPVSASNAVISQSVLDPYKAPIDAVFTPLSILDPYSGSQQAALTNTFYCSVHYAYPWRSHTLLVALGASYEHAHTISALSQWSVWGTLGMHY